MAAAAVAAFAFHRLPGEMRDFEVYWTAASRAAAAEPLYRAADGHYQFKYLPVFAVLASPLSWLSLSAAKSAWFTASVALLAGLIALSVWILPARRRPAWWLVVVMVVTMGKFYGHELVLGQVNLLFACVATTGILLLQRRQNTAAAALFTLAVAVKPYAVIFLPWLVAVRGRRVLPATAAGALLLLVTPVVFYGLQGTVDLHREWWITVTSSTAPNLTNADNVSIAGMFAKWFGVGRPASLATLAVTAVLGGAALLVVARRRTIQGAEALEGALLLTLVPLLSPQGWDYVFLVGTPAVALLANDDDRLPRALRVLTWLALGTIGLSLFDLMGRERYAAFMSWSAITVCFLVVAGGLVALRWKRIA